MGQVKKTGEFLVKICTLLKEIFLQSGELLVYNDIIQKYVFSGGLGKEENRLMLIFVEPNYANSMWCQNITEGLAAELKLKRIPFRFITCLEDLDTSCSFIYVIGSNGDWVRTVLEASNSRGIYPILLCNQAFHEPEMTYSTVCSDTSSMQHLVDTLMAAGRTRIALYGVNPHSVSDESREKSFRAATRRLDRGDVFINNGSLACCFELFRDRVSEYDAVICANDFAAISLVRNLLREDPESLERLLIIGCAETRLTEFYNDYVLSIRVNFQEYGRAAVTLLENLRRNPYLSHIVMAIRWDFSPLTPRCRLSKLPPAPVPTSASILPKSRDNFYQDKELENMLCLERLLNEIDQLDRELISCLLQGTSYETISERYFVTVGTIKYRIKKMITISGTAGRSDLIRLLREYLPALPESAGNI